MRRYLGLAITACALVLATRATAQRSDDKQSAFTFLDITDTQQTADGGAEPLQKLIADAAAMPQKPAFIVDTGDITAAGQPAEYAQFKQATAGLTSANIGFYAVP